MNHRGNAERPHHDEGHDEGNDSIEVSCPVRRRRSVRLRMLRFFCNGKRMFCPHSPCHYRIGHQNSMSMPRIMTGPSAAI